MKAEILNSNVMRVSSLEDLEHLIPSPLSGRALNYGQGEGQIDIEGCVWGLYVNENGNYTIQFEEGNTSLSDFMRILLALDSHLKNLFGTNIVIQVEGMLNHYQNHEKYT